MFGRWLRYNAVEVGWLVTTIVSIIALLMVVSALTAKGAAETTIQGPVYIFDLHTCAYDMSTDRKNIYIGCWSPLRVDDSITLEPTPPPARGT